ncbi:UNVERIFIED_CONTAM: hypothetical protein PYX00_005634 [Menopon gallinae]|uniref:U2A'/phosphoprotein 32 family A C-terminal domain-containing protein n=1 Tax=Menopon gallinae TaxID=328185 RepID=A0AAW2HTX5_9NEOP
MGPRPYSDRSVLPRDSSNSSVSVDSDTAQTTVDTSPGTLSSATTPSPIDTQMEINALVPEIQEEEFDQSPPMSSFYPTPADSMPFDHAFPDFIRQVTNESDLGNVLSLRIKVISRLVSLQRMSLFMTNLRELDLEGSILSSLRDIGCNLKFLQVLKVGNCQLDSLDGTFGLTSLRQLYAQRNQISDVSPCSNLPHIQHIDLSNNRIRNIAYAGFLSVCRKLKSVIFSGNPAATHPDYRNHVKKMLPRLQSLDDVPFTNQENEEVSKYVEQDEFEADFGDVNEDPDDFYDNASGQDAPTGSKSLAEKIDSDVFDNPDSEIQTILKYDNKSFNSRDFNLLSLRRERDESRQFAGSQIGRGININTEETEEIIDNCRVFGSCQSESNLTLPPLTVMDPRKSDSFFSGIRTDKLKPRISERPSTSHDFNVNTIPDAETMKTGARPRVLKKIERPSTANICASGGPNMNSDPNGKNDERRPFTAGSASTIYEQGSGDEGARALPQRSLTSGLPICGNLAVAMRHRKRQKEMELNRQRENQELDDSDMQ